MTLYKDEHLNPEVIKFGQWQATQSATFTERATVLYAKPDLRRALEFLASDWKSLAMQPFSPWNFPGSSR
jgi:hypothetical protein